MKEIISIEHLKEEIQLLEQILEQEISGIYIYTVEENELEKNSLTSENIIIQTENSEFHFFSQGFGQHYNGEYDIEILKELDKEFSEECEINQILKVNLFSSQKWAKFEQKKIKKIKIFSTSRKAFNLLKFRNVKPYTQAHYIEFTNENNELLSIGYYGNDSKVKTEFLNNYSWSGELNINLNHRITEVEMEKWDLKEIYKKSW